jgi:ribosomal protein S18 acetylase RimI-like enzyme
MVTVSDSRIEHDITNPSIIEVEGVGRVEYFEFEETIWAWGVYSTHKGKGNGRKLCQKLIEYAKKVNKDIYGSAWSDDTEDSLPTEKLIEWYESMGCKPIKMKRNPTAMKLEIRK